MVEYLTPTQRSILTLLSDGHPHSREEVHDCLPDELSGTQAIRKHLSLLRKKLRPIGLDISCEWRGEMTYYRRVGTTSRDGD